VPYYLRRHEPTPKYPFDYPFLTMEAESSFECGKGEMGTLRTAANYFNALRWKKKIVVTEHGEVCRATVIVSGEHTEPSPCKILSPRREMRDLA
jgi:hypothetical protein